MDKIGVGAFKVIELEEQTDKYLWTAVIKD